MKNITIFGGGTGLSTVLKGIKEIQDIKIDAVVTVADSGGSTGTIRKEYNVPALGDIRQVLIALSKKENVLNEFMRYRFKGDNIDVSLKNHSLGNLMIYSLIDIRKSFYDGIHYLSEIFNIKGRIIPVTDYSDCQLKAIYTDNSEQIGEHLIPKENKTIKTISYLDANKIKVNPLVIDSINDADIIVFSCGSLFTSIIACIALPEIKKALLENKEKTFLYISNIVTQPGETHGMNLMDHITNIENHLEYGIIDDVIINDTLPTKELIEKYKLTGSELLLSDDKLNNSHCNIYKQSLIDNNNHVNIRHDIKKIKKAFIKFLKEN